MLLGALMQAMKAAGLYSPRPLPPFSLLTLDVAIKSLRDAHSPTYFSLEEDSPLGNHSGKWRPIAQTDTVVVPTVAATSGLFSIAPAAGGLIGGQAHANTSQSFASDRFSMFALEKKDEPATLVRHRCCLKDLIDPLLRTTEAEIKGLKLEDYAQS
jgi:hypothetical protein